MNATSDTIARAFGTLAACVALVLFAVTGAVHMRGGALAAAVTLAILTSGLLVGVLCIAIHQYRRLLGQHEALSQDYEALLHTTPEGVIISDASDRITRINAQAEMMFGYTPGEMRGMQVDQLILDADRADFEGVREDLFHDPGAYQFGKQMIRERLRRKDGSTFSARLSLRPMHTAHGTAGLAVIQDVTARLHDEHEMETTNRALQLLSEISRIRRSAASDADLYKAICQTIVLVGGYPLAWIGRAEQDAAHSVRVVARHGEDSGYLRSARMIWDAAGTGHGPAGSAIRTGEPLIIRANASRDAESRMNAPPECGYQSVAGFPLRIDGLTEGALVIYSAADNAFGAEEYLLLQDLADEVAHAVSALRAGISRSETEQALRRSEATLERAQQIAHVGSWEWDLATGAQRWSAETCHLFGCGVDVARPSLRFILKHTHPDDRAHVCAQVKLAQSGEVSSVTANFRIVGDDGATLWVHARAEVEFHDTGPFRVVGVMQDVSERRHFEEKLAQIASHDGLTGLPNRHLLNDRMEQGLSHHRYTDRLLALVFVDLDRFKLINDTLGHDAGDQLLMEIAKRLSTCLRDGDTVARQGGDEFVVVLNDLAKAEDAAFVGQKMLDALAPPCYLLGHEVVPAASIGIALYPRDGSTIQELMMSADKAMYAAKQAGRGQYRFFDVEMNRAASDWLEVGAQLHHALERDEFELHYQPKVDFRSGLVTGVEALLRWRSAELGMIGPDRFIPILEETGRILEVGEWVIIEACRQARIWHAQGLGPPRVAVNLSPRQFQQPDLAMRVKTILEQEQVPANWLELEITESMVMYNVERAIVTLQDLRFLGLRLAIDDFGTGYSSLAALKRFPVDCLKIDRSFVHDVPHDSDDVAITRAVILLAHSMGLSVVAEGVETEAQRTFLIEAGCDEMQGYLFAKPMPGKQLSELLYKQREKAAA